MTKPGFKRLVRYNSIQLIGDLISSEFESPIQLEDDFQLRRATKKELTLITNDVHSSFGNDIFSKGFNPYTNRFDKGKKTIELNDEEHFCWVIEHNNRQYGSFDLDFLNLAKLDLTVLALYVYHLSNNSLINEEVTKIYQSHFAFSVFYSNLKFKEYPIKNLNEELISDLNITIKTVKHFKKYFSKDYPVVNKAFNDFKKLIEIPETSPFKILSYFAIIENLITSNNETSISSQLQNKIVLINNRLEAPIDIEKYFNSSPKLPTLINKLYNLRSQIAHGSFESFSKFQITPKFDSTRAISEFIYEEILKKLVLQSLIEPRLFEDLKKC